MTGDGGGFLNGADDQEVMEPLHYDNEKRVQDDTENQLAMLEPAMVSITSFRPCTDPKYTARNADRMETVLSRLLCRELRR